MTISEMRSTRSGISDPVIQSSTDKPDEALIKIPLLEASTDSIDQSEQQTEGAGAVRPPAR